MKSNLLKRFISSIILVPILLFVIIEGSFFFNISLIIFFLIVCFEWHHMTVGKFYKTIGFIFISFSFTSIYFLQNNTNLGYELIILIMSICVSTDIGGYIFGKILKGPKLTKISPNKTISGMIGSFILSVTFIFTLQKTKSLSLINNISFFELLIFILVISLVSQLGDLMISYFKRLSNLKDTGNIIPGHGGLLDRIDGMIFVFPMTFFFQKNQAFSFF